MEDYKKKYEDAIKELKKFFTNNDNRILYKHDIESVFPELKESEDERIRKKILQSIQDNMCVIHKDKCIAWLEKQGKKDSQVILPTFTFDDILALQCCMKEVQKDKELYEQLQSLHDRIHDAYWLERQEDANKEYWRGYKEGKQEIIDKYSELEKQGEQKEINLVEILKHYPKETELYSPLYGKLWLAELDEEHEIITCYKHPLSEGDVRAILEQEDTVSFYSNGTTGLPDFTISKDCMLFLYDTEKQGRQKPIDKVEPKFKAGDFIINEYDFIMQIDGIDDNMYVYHVLDNNHLLKHDITKTEESCHLWTIQDAKPGDVLVDNYGNIVIYQEQSTNLMYHSYCYGNKTCFVDTGGSHSIINTYPATKRQCDFLFQKMKEDGYEWDDEKKELKKFQQ